MILSIFEKAFIGGVGGLVAFWFAYNKFISQRWWDKRFDLYIEAIEILEKIEHSLAVYVCAIENDKTIESSETVKKAYLDFENGLSKIQGLQSKLIMIGLGEAQMKLMVLTGALSAIHPSYLSEETKEDKQELIDLMKQSMDMVGYCSGELACIGNEELITEWKYLKKIKALLRFNK